MRKKLLSLAALLAMSAPVSAGDVQIGGLNIHSHQETVFRTKKVPVFERSQVVEYTCEGPKLVGYNNRKVGYTCVQVPVTKTRLDVTFDKNKTLLHQLCEIGKAHNKQCGSKVGPVIIDCPGPYTSPQPDCGCGNGYQENQGQYNRPTPAPQQ